MNIIKKVTSVISLSYNITIILTLCLYLLESLSITVLVIDPTTQADNYMVSAHTAGDGMLTILIVIECH